MSRLSATPKSRPKAVAKIINNKCLSPSGREDVLTILVIGKTGSGKSSLIKYLTGDQSVVVSGAARGVRPDAHDYKKDSKIVEYGGRKYKFIDTAGIGEPPKGSVPTPEAVFNILKFATEYSFSLAIFMFSNERVESYDLDNYLLLNFIAPNVPIMCVTTKSDARDPIWKTSIVEEFQSYQMNFDLIPTNPKYTGVTHAFLSSNKQHQEPRHKQDIIKSCNQIWQIISQLSEPVNVDNKEIISHSEIKGNYIFAWFDKRSREEVLHECQKYGLKQKQIDRIIGYFFG